MSNSTQQQKINVDAVIKSHEKTEETNMTNEEMVYLIRNGVSPAELILQLWKQNYGLIRKIANRYNNLDDIEDLLQEGFLGLYESIGHYDLDGGVPFVNYAALWIRQAISRYVKRNGTIRIPEHAGNQVRAYRRMVSQWLSEFGRKPTEWEICSHLDITPGMVRQIEKDDQMGQVQSLDVPVGDEEDSSMYDMIPGATDLEEDVVDRVQQEQLRIILWKLVEELPGQQSEVLKKKYIEGKTLQVIGEDMGISRSCAQTMEARALRELRKPSKSKCIRPFMADRIRSIALSRNGIGSFNRTWTSSTERAVIWKEEQEEKNN